MKNSFAPRARGPVRCPVCGNRTGFVVLVATLRVHPVQQLSPKRWKAFRPMPKAFEPVAPILLLCDGCTQPLSLPPGEWLRRLIRRPKRKAVSSR